MSDPFPQVARAQQADPEQPVYVDTTLETQESSRRWEARAAQWRARELAEALFGGEVGARLTRRTSRGTFRGLLHLEVPFSDLDSHRSREAAFLACAHMDPVLSRVPLVIVFTPGGA